MSILIMHNSGFFSCCSVKLDNIVSYINYTKELPTNIDSSNQFEWYKTEKKGDITFDYFKHYNNDNLPKLILNNELYINYNDNHQYKNYSQLDYINLIPLIKKYFSPSNEIEDIIKSMEIKYNIDYNNICVLFYRGNDKNRETNICEYNEYIKYANEILRENKDIKFLIQSDETEFIEFMKSKYPNNIFYFKDEIRHMNKCDNTVDIVMKEQNFLFSKYYLAITIIMSRCKYIICGSGNCSLWIMLYRGNSKNVYQNLYNQWYKL